MRMSLRCLSETSARSRSIRRDVAFFEVAPIPRPGAGSTDRHWGCRDFGDAEGRTSGDAMWRWRWAATLLYTSVCTRGWHHAGAGTSPTGVRNGRRRTREDRVRPLEDVLSTVALPPRGPSSAKGQVGGIFIYLFIYLSQWKITVGPRAQKYVGFVWS